MRTLAGRVNRWRRSPAGTTAVRYVLTSAVAVVIGQITLIVSFGLLGWTARSANYLAFVAAGLPSYYLNRRWAWGKAGRSHLLKEVLPFWVIAFIGLGVSTFAVDIVDSSTQRVISSRSIRTLCVMAASLAAFGALWVAKFLLLNRYLFGNADQ